MIEAFFEMGVLKVVFSAVAFLAAIHEFVVLRGCWGDFCVCSSSPF